MTGSNEMQDIIGRCDDIEILRLVKNLSVIMVTTVLPQTPN